MTGFHRTPFTVLTRTFFARFFASETVTSDMRLRQTAIWVLAFLLTPGFVLMVQLFPAFQTIVIRARRFHSPGLIDDWLEWIAFVYITYSMVTVGLIAVFVWDTLNFDHRDAMVLGPAPLRARTIIGAKLAALAGLLAIAALPVNAVNGFFFASATADAFGAVTFAVHFIAFLVATLTAALFVFTALVAVRGAVSIVAGPRLAATTGSLLQFAFVVAMLSCVFLSPAMWKIQSAVINNPDTVGWLPSSWFLGLFERVRGSTRAYFQPLSVRALVAIPLGLAAAVAVSVASFSNAAEHAVSRSASSTGFFARALRAIGRSLAGRDPTARAVSDFMLVTIARNRVVHTPLAMNAALGVALALAALTRARTTADLMHPRTIVLWIPLLVGYWLAIGLRAATFMPSDHRASWIFAGIGRSRTQAFWSGTRAAMLAVVVSTGVSVAIAVVGPLVSWQLAAWHAAFVALVLMIAVDAIVVTIRHVPFTAIYRPGHARLRTRWPLYLIGMFATAVWPVWLEQRYLGGDERLLIANAGFVAIVVYFAGRRFGRIATAAIPEERGDEDDEGVTVLNLSLPRTV